MDGRSRQLRWLVPALVVVGWLVLGAVGGPFTGRLDEVVTNDGSAFLPASAESTEVAALRQRFGAGAGPPAVVVAERRAGVSAADRRFLDDALARLATLDGLGARSPVLGPSDDGAALRFVVGLTGTADAREVVAGVRAAVAGAPAGLTVLVTGPAAQIADLRESFRGVDGMLLLVAGGVVAVILVLVYRSPLLPVLVLLSSVFALGLASTAVFLLADHDLLALNGQSQGILFILIFGAATDYALLLVARFREELRGTTDAGAAIRTAWRATIRPITASACTVVLGVLCLLLSDLESNKGLGPVAAIGIVASLAASVTFLPATLALLGRTAFWPLRPRPGSARQERPGLWARVSRWISAAPRAIWVVTTLVLLVGAAFLPQLRADGTAQSDLFLGSVDSVAGQEVLARHFPGGAGTPTVIVARADRVAAVAAAAAVDGVSEVRPGAARELVELEVTLTDPADSEQAITTVQRIRAAVHAVPGAGALVGGPTAILLDTRDTSRADRALIIPVVLVVILVVLALLLRALVAPLVLIGTVVLSFAATMGVAALVFNHVLGFPGADPVIPLFGFVFLVALGIDYNIFLMTRVREEAARLGTRDGTLRGLSVTGGVITSAGVVLAATFAALAVLPILFLAQLAFIVAFGVLLDALVVRTLLVPALTVDIGDPVWWPGRP